jgi:hypothetical protein
MERIGHGGVAMNAQQIARNGLAGVLFLSVLLLGSASVSAGSPDRSTTADRNPSKILVEISLSLDHKKDVDAIKREFAAVGISKIRHKVFTVGHPPRNIAIGRNVSAPIARLVIRLAQTYNDGVSLLLPEERLASNYIAIGSSIFDELFQYPITEDNLTSLADPNLTTDQFHTLYRQLANIERRPYR